MKKTIITVVGKDTVGIIAKVCNYLAENQVNIEDISQTILEKLGSSIGVVIRCQHEDIFNMMHRI